MLAHPHKRPLAPGDPPPHGPHAALGPPAPRPVKALRFDAAVAAERECGPPPSPPSPADLSGWVEAAVDTDDECAVRSVPQHAGGPRGPPLMRNPAVLPVAPGYGPPSRPTAPAPPARPLPPPGNQSKLAYWGVPVSVATQYAARGITDLYPWQQACLGQVCSPPLGPCPRHGTHARAGPWCSGQRPREPHLLRAHERWEDTGGGGPGAAGALCPSACLGGPTLHSPLPAHAQAILRAAAAGVKGKVIVVVPFVALVTEVVRVSPTRIPRPRCW